MYDELRSPEPRQRRRVEQRPAHARRTDPPQGLAARTRRTDLTAPEPRLRLAFSSPISGCVTERGGRPRRTRA
jgi:hypothetical protein